MSDSQPFENEKIITPNAKSAAKLQARTCGMNKILSDLKTAYRFLITLLKNEKYDGEELNRDQLTRLKEFETYWRPILKAGEEIVEMFDTLDGQKHLAKRRYPRFWLKSGLLLTDDSLMKLFYQTLDAEHFKNWLHCGNPIPPDIALGDVGLAREDISGWLNDEKVMKHLQDFKYDMEQSLRLEKIKQDLAQNQNEEYCGIIKPICNSFDEFTNITHYNCQEILQQIA